MGFHSSQCNTAPIKQQHLCCAQPWHRSDSDWASHPSKFPVWMICEAGLKLTVQSGEDEFNSGEHLRVPVEQPSLGERQE